MADQEDEIFAEATATAPEAHVESQPTAPAVAEAPASAASEPTAVEQPVAQPTTTEEPAKPNGGDLTVALRQEREERRRLEAQILQLMERVAPPAPQPQAKTQEQLQAEEDAAIHAVLNNPTAWLKDQLKAHLSEHISPVNDALYETRKNFSLRLAVQEHGVETVKQAYGALDEAIASGKLKAGEVDDVLRKSQDPAAEILGWYNNQPEIAEKRLREKYFAEFQAQAASAQPAAGHAASFQSAPDLPSLNRAIGNAGAPQSGSITDDDIFNAAPAFGKRKA
jgi:hypothetical protein